MATATMNEISVLPSQSRLLEQFTTLRKQSLNLCAPLSAEDMMVQSCPEASPAKWHLAHTTWFFETFLLREFLDGYTSYNPDYLWLFNSYYNSISTQPQKKLRASFARPRLDDVLAYREHVEQGISRLFDSPVSDEAARRLILGLHHEQQHDELLLTDIKHALWSNPLRPAYLERRLPAAATLDPISWTHIAEGLYPIGHQGEGFCFDNELPRHRVWIDAFKLASRTVSCAEYLQFIEDGGYSRSDLWLSEAWETVQREQWQAPLYWSRDSEDSEWNVFTLRGEQPLNSLLNAPVCHVSYFEAKAFALWAGMSLPTEAEWEVAAEGLQPEPEDFLEGGYLHPLSAAPHLQSQQMLGSVWEWTESAYLGYPGYAALPGALGEYNGKFMCNQMVLRGGSVATPVSHIRASYRNFFPPHTRWQFSGVRLVRR